MPFVAFYIVAHFRVLHFPSTHQGPIGDARVTAFDAVNHRYPGSSSTPLGLFGSRYSVHSYSEDK